MPFDFELSFTGLCAFTFRGDRRDPEVVNVLLVKTATLNGNGKPNGHHAPKPDHSTNGGEHGAHNGGEHEHRHFPLLTYWAKDLTSRSDREHQLFPGPDGQLIAMRPLDGRELRIVPPKGSPEGVKPVWRPADPFEAPPPRAPRMPAEESWLDWALSYNLMDETVTPDVLDDFGGLLSDEATTTIRLTAGTLEAAQVVRSLNGPYTVWDLREQGTPTVVRSQAIAEKIVLRLTGLESPVRFEGFDGIVEFAPPGPLEPARERLVVKASITNLPNRELELEEMGRPQHLERFFDLVGPTGARRLRLPEASDLLDTPSSALCPPAVHG